MKEAVCLRCGAWKDWPWRRCQRCGLDPRADPEALVRSVYLSTGRFDEVEEQDPYREELRAVARVGRPDRE